MLMSRKEFIVKPDQAKTRQKNIVKTPQITATNIQHVETSQKVLAKQDSFNAFTSKLEIIFYYISCVHAKCYYSVVMPLYPDITFKHPGCWTEPFCRNKHNEN